MPDSSDVPTYIVECVAEAEEVAPDDLPPLAETIPPAAFHRLTGPGGLPPERLEFSYLWYEVTVEPGGDVTILA